MITLRPAAERGTTRIDWLDSRHSFSFGEYYDPGHMGFRALRVINDDRVAPAAGFGTHPHRDMEILTWVLEGELEHQDSEGHKGLIVPGDAQRMSAGTGILHSEMNYSAKTDVRFVQMWVLPDTKSIAPGYQETSITDLLDSGQLFPIASGRGHDGAVSIQQKAAALWGARLKPGASVTLPDAPYVHLYVARGPIDLEGAGRLAEGDAARMIAADGRRVTAPADGAGAEILAWEFRP